MKAVKAGMMALGALSAAILPACAPENRAPPPAEMPSFVSLNPCVDAILVEVAQPQQILALSHYSHDPQSSSMDVAQARQFGVTGGTVEEVLALQPDHVLAGSFIPPNTAQAMDDLGLQTTTFGIANTPQDSFVQIRQIAELAGNRASGEALIERIEQALEQGTDAPRGEQSALLWQAGEIVPGEQSMIVALMKAAGFTNHAETLGLGQAERVALEDILRNPPDIVLVAGGSAGQKHPVIEQLPSTRVVQFDPSLFYCGGPSIMRAVERLSDIRAGGA